MTQQDTNVFDEQLFFEILNEEKNKILSTIDFDEIEDKKEREKIIALTTFSNALNELFREVGIKKTIVVKKKDGKPFLTDENREILNYTFIYFINNIKNFFLIDINRNDFDKINDIQIEDFFSERFYTFIKLLFFLFREGKIKQEKYFIYHLLIGGVIFTKSDSYSILDINTNTIIEKYPIEQYSITIVDFLKNLVNKFNLKVDSEKFSKLTSAKIKKQIVASSIEWTSRNIIISTVWGKTSTIVIDNINKQKVLKVNAFSLKYLNDLLRIKLKYILPQLNYKYTPKENNLQKKKIIHNFNFAERMITTNFFLQPQGAFLKIDSTREFSKFTKEFSNEIKDFWQITNKLLCYLSYSTNKREWIENRVILDAWLYWLFFGDASSGRALILISPIGGVGKGTFLESIKDAIDKLQIVRIHGFNAYTELTPSVFERPFNKWLTSRLIYVDELAQFDLKISIKEKFKEYINEGIITRTIEQKGKEPVHIQTTPEWLFLTNKLYLPFHLRDSERRYLIIFNNMSIDWKNRYGDPEIYNKMKKTLTIILKSGETLKITPLIIYLLELQTRMDKETALKILRHFSNMRLKRNQKFIFDENDKKYVEFHEEFVNNFDEYLYKYLHFLYNTVAKNLTIELTPTTVLSIDNLEKFVLIKNRYIYIPIDKFKIVLKYLQSIDIIKLPTQIKNRYLEENSKIIVELQNKYKVKVVKSYVGKNVVIKRKPILKINLKHLKNKELDEIVELIKNLLKSENL